LTSNQQNLLEQSMTSVGRDASTSGIQDATTASGIQDATSAAEIQDATTVSGIQHATTASRIQDATTPLVLEMNSEEKIDLLVTKKLEQLFPSNRQPAQIQAP